MFSVNTALLWSFFGLFFSPHRLKGAWTGGLKKQSLFLSIHFLGPLRGSKKNKSSMATTGVPNFSPIFRASFREEELHSCTHLNPRGRRKLLRGFVSVGCGERTALDWLISELPSRRRQHMQHCITWPVATQQMQWRHTHGPWNLAHQLCTWSYLSVWRRVTGHTSGCTD